MAPEDTSGSYCPKGVIAGVLVKQSRKNVLQPRYTLHRMSEKKPQPISPVQRIRPSVQEKIAACHSPEAERALEVAFRRLEADERVREEEHREGIRRAGSSPLGKLEPQFGGRVRD